jgi:hypothetical protein
MGLKRAVRDAVVFGFLNCGASSSRLGKSTNSLTQQRFDRSDLFLRTRVGAGARDRPGASSILRVAKSRLFPVSASRRSTSNLLKFLCPSALHVSVVLVNLNFTFLENHGPRRLAVFLDYSFDAHQSERSPGS